MTTALLVIDVQNIVMAYAHDAAGVTWRIRVLVDQARQAGSPVVWVQHHDEGLAQGSPEWEIVPELVPADGEVRIFKTFSDSFSGTDLEAQLRALGVTKLVVTGAQTDFCIRNAWHSALVRGFSAVLVKDAHTTVDASFEGTELTAEWIIAYTNYYATFGSNYPGAQGSAALARDVTFAS